MNWYLKVLKAYATFEGRAQRAEYWFSYLFYTIFLIIAIIVDVAMGTYDEMSGLGLISGLFILIHFLPFLAVSVRRLHDIGKSGWWYLLIIIPLIGPLVLLVFAVMDSKEANRYGPNPKLAAAVV